MRLKNYIHRSSRKHARDQLRCTRRAHDTVSSPASYLEFITDFKGRDDLAFAARVSDRQVLFAWAAGRKAVSMIGPEGENRLWMKAPLFGWTSLDSSPHVVHNILELGDVVGIEKYDECVARSDPDSPARISELLPFDWRDKAYAVIHPYPRNCYKQWTLGGWKTLADFLVERGVSVVVTGGADEVEMEYVNPFVNSTSRQVFNVAGRIKIADAAELLKHSKLYAGPDTAITHLASFGGVPTVALFGKSLPHDVPYHSPLHSDPPRELTKRMLRTGNVYVVTGECDCPRNARNCSAAVREMGACMKNLQPGSGMDVLGSILQ